MRKAINIIVAALLITFGLSVQVKAQDYLPIAWADSFIRWSQATDSLVRSIKKSGEATVIRGNVILSEGDYLLLTQDGNNILISGVPADSFIRTIKKAGESNLVGNVVIEEGEGIDIDQVGNNLVFTSSVVANSILITEFDSIFASLGWPDSFLAYTYIDTFVHADTFGSKVDTSQMYDSLVAHVILLGGKTDTLTFHDSLLAKIDTSYITVFLDSFFIHSGRIAQKVDTNAFFDSLLNHVNILGTKIDTGAFNDSLRNHTALIDTKTDTGAFYDTSQNHIALIGGKTDTTKFNDSLDRFRTTQDSIIGTKADTQAFYDSLLNHILLLAGKVDTTIFFDSLLAKLDSSTLSNLLDSLTNHVTLLGNKIDTADFYDSLLNHVSLIGTKADTGDLTNLLLAETDTTRFKEDSIAIYDSLTAIRDRNTLDSIQLENTSTTLQILISEKTDTTDFNALKDRFEEDSSNVQDTLIEHSANIESTLAFIDSILKYVNFKDSLVFWANFISSPVDTLKDYSDNSSHIPLLGFDKDGTDSWGESNWHSVLTFNGPSDRGVGLIGPIDSLCDWTVEIAVMLNDTAQNRTIISMHESEYASNTAGNAFVFYYNSTTHEFTGIVDNSEYLSISSVVFSSLDHIGWNYFTFVKNDTTLFMYANGILVDQAELANYVPPIDTLVLGSVSSTGSVWPLDGSIAFVRIYKNDFTQKEISTSFSLWNNQLFRDRPITRVALDTKVDTSFTTAIYDSLLAHSVLIGAAIDTSGMFDSLSNHITLINLKVDITTFIDSILGRVDTTSFNDSMLSIDNKIGAKIDTSAIDGGVDITVSWDGTSLIIDYTGTNDDSAKLDTSSIKVHRGLGKWWDGDSLVLYVDSQIPDTQYVNDSLRNHIILFSTKLDTSNLTALLDSLSNHVILLNGKVDTTTFFDSLLNHIALFGEKIDTTSFYDSLLNHITLFAGKVDTTAFYDSSLAHNTRIDENRDSIRANLDSINNLRTSNLDNLDSINDLRSVAQRDSIWIDSAIINLRKQVMAFVDTNNIVAYFPYYHIATDSLYDESGKNHSFPAYNFDGSPINGITTEDFFTGLAVDSLSYAEVDTNLGIDGYPFTLSTWVKIKDALKLQTLISLVDSTVANVMYGISINSNDSAQIFVSNTNFLSISSRRLTRNRWYNITARFVSDTKKVLYINGDSVATLVNSCAFNSGVNRISIGRRGDLTPSSYANNIIIAGTAIYNRDLSSKEVAIISHPFYSLTQKTLRDIETEIGKRPDTSKIIGVDDISVYMSNDSLFIAYTGLDSITINDRLASKLDTNSIIGSGEIDVTWDGSQLQIIYTGSGGDASKLDTNDISVSGSTLSKDWDGSTLTIYSTAWDSALIQLAFGKKADTTAFYDTTSNVRVSINSLDSLMEIVRDSVQKNTVLVDTFFSYSSFTDSLIFYYSFEDRDSTYVADLSGKENNGTLINMGWNSSTSDWVMEGFRSALVLDSLDDGINISDDDLDFSSNGGALSIMLKMSRLNSGAHLFTRYSSDALKGYQLKVHSDSSIIFGVRNGGAWSETKTDHGVFIPSKWNTLTVSFDSLGRKIFVNGVDRTLTGGDETILPPDTLLTLNIGRSWDEAYKFIGYMSFITAHNKKLTDEEAIWIGSEYMGLLLNSQTLISVTDSINTLRNEISYETSGLEDLTIGLEYWPDLANASKAVGIPDLSGNNYTASVIINDDDSITFFQDDWKALMSVNGKDDGAVATISTIDSLDDWTLAVEVILDNVATTHTEKFISGFGTGVEAICLYYNQSTNKFEFKLRNSVGTVDTLFDTTENPTTAQYFVVVKNGNNYILYLNGDSIDGETSSIKPIPFDQIVLGPRNATSFKNLTVEKFANLAQRGAIHIEDKQVIVENCNIRWNHGVGLKGWNNSIFKNNDIHHNGQMGVSILDGVDALIYKNEIYNNNTTGYSVGWEAGGTKFWDTESLVVRGNYSHNNTGPGLWTDNDNIYTLYEDNVIINNSDEGIFHEISYEATIRNNIVMGNGFRDPRWGYGAGLFVSSSRDVELYNNLVINNGRSMTAVQQNRGTGDYGAWEVWNLDYHDNYVVTNDTGSYDNNEMYVGLFRDTGDNTIFTSRNNRFRNNIYNTSTGLNIWKWMNVSNTFTTWQTTYGQDVNGKIDADDYLGFVGGDTSGVGIDATISYGTTCPPGAIQIDTTDDIQNIIDAHPAGTYYFLMPGNHRMIYSGNNATMIVPKTGDVFLGADGAIINGSVLLTDFTFSSPNYVKTGLTQAGTVFGTGSYDAQYPEDLYMDDVLLTQEDALGDLGAGEWFFDYGANTVYMRDDPSGHKIELTSHTYGVRSTDSDTYTESNGSIRAIRFYNNWTPTAIQVKTLYQIEQGQQIPTSTNYVTKPTFNAAVASLTSSIASKLDTNDITVSGALTASWDGDKFNITSTSVEFDLDTLNNKVDSLEIVIQEQFEDLEATKFVLWQTLANLDSINNVLSETMENSFDTMTIYTVLGDSLIYFPMAGYATTDTAFDRSGNSFDGTYSNFDWNTPKFVNQGNVASSGIIYSSFLQTYVWAFDSSDSRIVIAGGNEELNLSNGGTIELWTYLRSFGKHQYSRFIDHGGASSGGYLIYSNSADSAMYMLTQNTTTTTTANSNNATIELGEWQHWIFEFDANGRDISLNTQSVIETGATQTALPRDTTASNTYFGSNNDGARTIDGYVFYRIFKGRPFDTSAKKKSLYLQGIQQRLPSTGISRIEILAP